MTEQHQRQLHIVRVVASNGFGRRLFFDGPGGVEGQQAVDVVVSEAKRLSGQVAELSELCSRLTTIASEHGLRRVAH